MKKKLPISISSFYQKGFTLIELLVVLGILGILAAALLAAINPVEQLKKAQDTSLKNVSSQFVSASVQYYSVHNSLPWSVAGGCNGGTTSLVGTQLSALSTCVTSFITDGELKGSFANVTNLDQAIVFSPSALTGNASDVEVCFRPQSNAQQFDANTKYTSAGTATTGCKSQVGNSGTTCYWCAQ